MKQPQTKKQILKRAIEKHGTLTVEQITKLARKHNVSESSLRNYYIEYYNELTEEK